MKSDTHSNRITMASLLVAMGIIYGDIGTSPLYVLKAIVGDRSIDETLVLGGVSCVFWTLVFQTTIKYITLTLMADNQCEGGIFSLYALVKRYGKYLVIPTILGATTLLADGIITPPISVASAVEGVEMIIPHIPTVPIVVVILSLLFFFQRFGTQKVGTAFGSIMFIWFSMLFVIGVSQIVHFPDVMNYMGQAAWLLHQGDPLLSGRNPFFGMMPQWFLLPGIIIATAAAIIASQALISGSFTLISEAMSLNFWPRVAVRQPSDLKGQIYIPSVNTILWIGCVMMILYFQSSTHMEAAYGFSITIAMMMTTILLSYFLIYKLKWNIVFVVLILLLFGTIEISFFITNVVKIKERWMFLFFELLIFAIMYTWYYARKINNRFVKFVELGKYTTLIRELSEDDSIPKFATHLIYLTKANHREQIEEKVIKSILSKKPKRADVYWFLHIHRTDEPYTLTYDVSELVDDKIIKVNIHIGFRVQAKTELFFKRIVQELVVQKELNLHIRPDGSTKYNHEPDFKFVVLEKFLLVENEFTLKEGLLLNGYFYLKHLGQSDEKAFGLDKSDVIIEQVPLVYHAGPKVSLTRKMN